MPDTLTLRALNRATLARQMLLERENVATFDAIGRLAGLQAQEAKPPFIGLWTRLQDFRREDLIQPLINREVVRVTAMRGTLHLLSARDYTRFRSTLQPMLSAGMQAILKERVADLDMDGLVSQARAYFDEAPRTFDAFRDHLLACDPACDARALAYSARMHLPLVQIPTDAPWGFPSSASFAPAETWLATPMDTQDRAEELVLRYLAAFGPASVTDAQTWFGFRLKEAFEALRPKLLTFKDEKRRELFDLPDAPRPPEETPAPVRFLPEFDNLLLSHADRTRIIADQHRGKVVTKNLRVHATFLVDGFVAGTWKIERRKATATLVLEPFEPLPDTAQEELIQEGERLVRFVEEDAAEVGVRIED